MGGVDHEQPDDLFITQRRAVRIEEARDHLGNHIHGGPIGALGHPFPDHQEVIPVAGHHRRIIVRRGVGRVLRQGKLCMYDRGGILRRERAGDQVALCPGRVLIPHIETLPSRVTGDIRPIWRAQSGRIVVVLIERRKRAFGGRPGIYIAARQITIGNRHGLGDVGLHRGHGKGILAWRIEEAVAANSKRVLVEPSKGREGRGQPLQGMDSG